MIHVTCRLTAKNRDQLRDPTLGNRLCMGYLNLSTHQTHNSCEYSIYRQYCVRARVLSRLQCPSCGRDAAARCLGPHLCCYRDSLCEHDAAVCRAENMVPTPCTLPAWPTCGHQSLCVTPTLCCDDGRSVRLSVCWTQSRFATSNTGTGVNAAGDAGDTYPPKFWLVGTSTGISPQYYYVLSDITDHYWLPYVRSASSRFHSVIRRHQFASVRQVDSRLTRLVPPTLNSR